MRPRPKMLGAKTARTIHDFSARLGTGEERPLTDYRGKVLLVVNVASKCGFTPQYNGLQILYEQFQPRGFEILAFPCDQFGGPTGFWLVLINSARHAGPERMASNP